MSENGKTIRELRGADNPYRVWAERNDDKAPSPATAQNRFLSGDYFIVQPTPSFSLSPGSRIYTIGSCFARNVEAELLPLGFDLPTTRVKVPQDYYSSPPAYPNTILNRYNAHSMADEIMRALGRAYPDSGLIEVGQGWLDPATSHVDPREKQEVLAMREHLDGVSRELLTCDVLVLTLGLTETWRDRQTGAILNVFHPRLARYHADRMEMFNARPQDCYAVLSEAIAALKAVRPSIKVIVTVSPVPMRTTFVNTDVVMANTYSKSTLRVTAQMLVDEFDFVDYFPSYEMVMNSPRQITWAQDQIHPRKEAVAKVIGKFVSSYAPA